MQGIFAVETKSRYDNMNNQHRESGRVDERCIMSSGVTTLRVDGHVHLYPGYDWRVAVRAMVENLGKGAEGEAVLVGLLAEGAGVGFFREVRANPERFRSEAVALEPSPDPGALVVKAGGRGKAYLVAGRQVVTAERLEVLAIGTDADIPDGQPVRRTLELVKAAGAVAVLSWSPGKWFFGRGKLVRRLLEEAPAGSFLLGDTALRPMYWPFPSLMALGRRRGFKVVGGSDPLPLPDEERRIGTYGVCVRAAFDPEAPAESVRRMMAYGNVFYTPIGERLCPLVFARKWVANQKGRKTKA